MYTTLLAENTIFYHTITIDFVVDMTKKETKKRTQYFLFE